MKLCLLLSLLAVTCITTTIVQAEENDEENNALSDLYYCEDPLREDNLLPCDRETNLWDLDALQEQTPDNSQVCQELLQILLEAKQEENDDDSTYDDMINSVVVDALKPCVLWALEYGPLRDQDNGQATMTVDFQRISLQLIWDRYINGGNDLSSPRQGSDATLSMDRQELVQITRQHLQEALMAELRYQNTVDLELQSGVPTMGDVTRELVLPITLSGTATVPRNTLGEEALTRILRNAFADPNANELYLFRLRRAQDPTLKMVAEVRMDSNGNRPSGNDAAPSTTTSNNDDDDFLSTLLIAIIASVAVAILAVVCFVYCLVCRNNGNKYSDADSQWLDLDESVYDVEKGQSVASQRSFAKRKISYSNRKQRQSRNVGAALPHVQTAPTDESNEHGAIVIDYAESEISASVIMNDDSNTLNDTNTIGDGVSELDMETLPPPTSVTHQVMPNYGFHDDDDDDMTMSLVGFVPSHEQNDNDDDDDDDDDDDADDVADDVSDAATSLYSYIPDDTSLATYNNNSVMQDTAFSRVTLREDRLRKSAAATTTLQQTSQKGLLWSVMDTLKRVEADGAKSDTDQDMYLEEDYQNYGKDLVERRIITSSSRDNNLLGSANSDGGDTDDDNASLLRDVSRSRAMVHNSGGMSHVSGGVDHDDNGTISTLEDSTAPPHDKEQFEDLWTDGDDDQANAAAAAANATPTKDESMSSPEAAKTEKRRNTRTSSSGTPIDLDTLDDIMTANEEYVEPAQNAVADAADSAATDKATTEDAADSSISKEVDDVAKLAAKEGNTTPGAEAHATLESPTVLKGMEDSTAGEELQDSSTKEKGAPGTASQKSTPPVGDVDESTDYSASKGNVVDWVPIQDDDVEDYDANEMLNENIENATGEDDDDDDKRALPLPAALQSSSKDAANKNADSASDVSSVSSTSISPRKVASARKKRSSEWSNNGGLQQSPSTTSLSDHDSVCSTDSAAFRSLLGQSDTNDAALVFANKLNLQDDTTKSSSDSSNDDPVNTSMGSCSSQKLQSLLNTTNGSEESVDNDDLLPAQGPKTAVRSQDIMRPIVKEEEKKENFSDDSSDEGRNQTGYLLPPGILPTHSHDSAGDHTVTSQMTELSEAPSVDATIEPHMGWF